MSTPSKALDDGLRVLEFLSEQVEPQTLSECCRRLDLPKSRAHRLLITLEGRGYLVRNDRLEFQLGPRVLELVGSYDPWLRLRQAASPVMRDMAEKSRKTCHLAVLLKGNAVYVDKVDSPKTISLASKIGSTAALHASSVGKALLSALSPERAEALLASADLPQLTANTIVSHDELERELERTRVRGYALDDEEEDVGVSCIGAPIFGHDRAVVAAISLAGLSVDFHDEELMGLAEILCEGARQISRHLGYVAAEEKSVKAAH